ncbi:molybdopterin-guanine dinucleotide biosynthesis protein B [Evansella halocellulosilytica]|uniref:molybdopterin-guanine dinucleotide biosynthesis protein B n=1 Tax=Evansella halocellulosilytica TaxID=2011013 RepID=UPI000BB8969F|nr:molybdopterin-guanine dinucleotide biosynthesis protein B [Evansella halocellulosilytica]
MTTSKRKILQVVGFSNSGKTTFITELIKRAVHLGYSAVTIKHHGHESKLRSIDQETDSFKHRQAGAVGSIVASSNELQIQVEGRKLSLEQLIRFYSEISFDFLLIEGFKKEKYQKVLLLKNEQDALLIEECENVKFIICWKENQREALKNKLSIPVFHMSEKNNYLDTIITSLIEQEEH